jgi:hypothetical protein
MTTRVNHNSVVHLLLLFTFLLSGCVTLATDYRKIGFKEMQRGFATLEKRPSLHETITLENITVHIIGNRDSFKWDKAAAFGSPVLGYATRKNEIYIFGAYAGGKIIINQGILGHELNHLLNFKNPIIADPDKLDDLGA